jgi:hypothetical protein
MSERLTMSKRMLIKMTKLSKKMAQIFSSKAKVDELQEHIISAFLASFLVLVIIC